MSVFTATLIYLAMQAPPANPPAPVDPADVARVAAAVERAMPTSRMLEGLVTQKVFVGTKGEPAPNPDREAPRLTNETLVRLLGPGRAVTSQRPLRNVNVLADGMTYQVRLGETDSSARKGMQTYSGELALLLQVDSFAPLGLQQSLTSAVRECHPISFTMNGTIATLRFVDASEQRKVDEAFERRKKDHPDEAPWKATPREVTVDLADPPRVIGFEMDFPRQSGGAAFRNEFVVDAWQEFDGTLIPRSMRISSSFPDDIPNVQVIELSRLSAIGAGEKRTLTDAHPLPAGLHVVDNAAKFSFTVGSDAIVYQDRHLKLKEPLWLHPGDKLEELVRDAVEE